MSKRGENIRKRKDGRWEGRYPGKDGKTHSVYGKTYKEVKKKLSQRRVAEKETSSGAGVRSAPVVLFQDVCEAWLYQKSLKIKASSYSTYHTTVYNHLISLWGEKDVFQIDFSTEAQKMIQQKIEEELSAKRIHEIIQRLKQILKFAQSRYSLPQMDIQADIQKYIRKEIQVLTEEEQLKLTNLLLIKKGRRKLGVLLSLYMGLRIGEVCALTWEDIDFEAGTLTISKTLQRIKNFDKNASSKTKIIVGTPKSAKSCRCLPIPKFLLEILRECRSSNYGYILTGSAVSFIEPRQYENIFHDYLKEAEIRVINYHALRHSFATRAVERNVDIKTLSEILGHSSVAITLQLYVHPTMAAKQKSMEQIAS